MNKSSIRWIILFAGFLANMCQGLAYASSVFMAPIVATFGVEKAQASLAFSLIVGCLPIGSIAGGFITGKKGPRLPIVLGSVIFCLGLIVASFAVKADNMALLYAGFGVMMGIGSGMAYGTIVGVVAQWFPDMRGFATGLVVAALGGGPLILAPFAQWLLNTYELQGTYMILGILFMVIMVCAALVVKQPEAVAGSKAAGGTGRDYTAGEMLKTSTFWLIAFMYAAGAFAGLMIVSQAKGITLDVIEDTGFVTQNPEMLAVTGVMVLAVANAFGRLVWGAVSDRLGRMPALIIMFALNCLIMAFMTIISQSFPGFMGALVLVGLLFGGYLGLFPSVCADYFGSRNVSLNYGILFAAFAVAGVAGPMVGALLEPVAAYCTAAILSLLGLGATIIVSKKRTA
ncbi:MAG: OFA family MFS transporter [Abditibacteriota bacterium]|nr:OFA family MFS transporter [Abditibacteriota bacterium]